MCDLFKSWEVTFDIHCIEALSTVIRREQTKPSKMQSPVVMTRKSNELAISYLVKPCKLGSEYNTGQALCVSVKVRIIKILERLHGIRTCNP